MKLNEQSDEQLVLAYRECKAPHLFGELYQRYYKKLFYYCLKIVRNRENAYDITADTFLKAAENIHRLKAPGQFAFWLFRIARNGCMDQGKITFKKPTATMENYIQLEEDNNDLENLLEKELQLDRLAEVLEQIPSESKALLLAKYCDGIPISTLMQQYNCSESAVKMRLVRARNKVQYYLCAPRSSLS